MKRALIVLGETILLYLTALLTNVLMLIKPQMKISALTFTLWQTANEKRIFDADWILGVLLIAAVIALIAVLRKRVQTHLPLLGIALVLAMLLGFWGKFGLATHPVYGY